MYSRDYAIKVDFKVFPTQFPFDTKAIFVNGDVGCKMTAHLVSGGIPIDLTDSLVTINIKESNDSVYTLTCEILDKLNGIVYINLPHSLNDDVGTNIFEIVIRNSDDSIFVSPLLRYKVVHGIGTGDIPKEEPKLLILDTLISKVQKLDVNFQDGISRISQLEASENTRVSNENTRISNENRRQEVFDSTIDRINSAISGGTHDLEVKEARTSLDGTVYDTLNERLNAIETNPYILFETVEGWLND